MSIKTFIADWQTVQGGVHQLAFGYDLPTMKPVKLKQDQQLVNINDLNGILDTLSSAEGWLMLPGEVIRLPSPVALTSEQPPLEAEALVGHQTWQLRHLHTDQWMLIVAETEDCDPADATHLSQHIQHQATRKQDPAMSYRVLWELREHQPPRRCTALFTGFEEKKA